MPALGQDKKHGKEGFYRNTSTIAIRLDKGPQSTGGNREALLTELNYIQTFPGTWECHKTIIQH